MPGPHYGGPHSGPYKGQDPNPTPEEMYAQAGEILLRVQGSSVAEVAKHYQRSRQWVYNRLALISGQMPHVDVVRLIHYERLEAMIEAVQGRLDGEISNTDYFRGIAERRRLLARQSALLRVESEALAPAEEEHAEDDYVRAVRAESDAALADGAAELRTNR